MISRKRTKIFVLISILSLTAIVCSSSVEDAPSSGLAVPVQISAVIREMSGQVQVLKPDNGILNDASIGDQVVLNDQVVTFEDSRARIDLSTGTIIRMSPLSTFVLEEMQNNADGPYTRLRLEVGKLWIILNGGTIEVDTPSGQASVRGSYLHVWVKKDTGETVITCLEGECTLGNESGGVSLVAGQSAVVSNSASPPVQGDMDQSDVNEWLLINPEATLVIQPLTATVGANSGGTDDSSTPTFTPSPTSTQSNESSSTDASGNTVTPTHTLESCGPPADWVLHTLTSGEDLETLSHAYQVSVYNLQYANCLGDSTDVIPGMGLFVPHVATVTPGPSDTPTFTPRPTNTQAGNGTGPTATFTATSASVSAVTPSPTVPPYLSPTPTLRPAATVIPSLTPIPSNPNGTLTTIAFPSGNIGTCSNKYEIDVIDPDGISFVKVFYNVNNNIVDDANYHAYLTLSNIGGDTYSGSFAIDTYVNSGKDIVYFRFVDWDATGFLQFYPTLDLPPLSYTDKIGCGNNASVFSSQTGPAGTDAVSCAVFFSVMVTDVDGLDLAAGAEVYLHWGFDTNVINYVPMDFLTTGVDAYGTDSTAFSLFPSTSDPYIVSGGETIYYQFQTLDNRGFYNVDGTTYVYTNSAFCQ